MAKAMVTVKYASQLRKDLGREQEQVRARTMAELLAELSRRHGRSFTSWMPSCRIFVNGSSLANLDGHNTPLAEGDEVVFLLPVAGG